MLDHAEKQLANLQLQLPHSRSAPSNEGIPISNVCDKSSVEHTHQII